jgi:hypothetical protein
MALVAGLGVGYIGCQFLREKVRLKAQKDELQ